MDNPKIFSAIKSFVTEIKNIYGNDYKHLALYGRLLEKTEVVNEIPVQKHISAFRKFVLTNRDGILNKDESLFKIQKIKYNDKVHFNIVHVLKLADNDSRGVIWEHLLVLSALLDKNSDAKNQLILQRNQQSKSQQPNVLMPMMNMITNMLMSETGGNSSGMPDLSGLSALLQTTSTDNNSSGSGMPDISKILSLLTNSDMLSKLTATITNSVSDGKIDLNSILSSFREITQEYNIDLNIPKDTSELKHGMEDVMGLFKNFGVSSEQINSMVDVISNTHKHDNEPDNEPDNEHNEHDDDDPDNEYNEYNEYDDDPDNEYEYDDDPDNQHNEPIQLVDNTKDEPLEPGIQVCYLNGTCE